MSTLSVHRIENVQDFDFANTPFVTAFNAANGAYAVSNVAFNTANAAYGTTNVAYGFANSVNTFAYGVALNAASAFAAANNVGPQIAPAFDTANAAYNAANNVGPQIAPAFNTANASYTFANSAYASINSNWTVTNALYTVSNSAYAKANSSVSKSGDTITGTLNIVGDLIISGNAKQISSNTLSVSDPLIYLAANNYSSDIVDIGFVANYVNSTGQNAHTGLYRSSGTKEYYLFYGYDKEPDNNYIDPTGNNIQMAVLNSTVRTSNLILGGANTINWITAGYGTANASYNEANAVYGTVNAAYGFANSAYASINSNWTVTNTVYGVANAAYANANSKLANATTTYSGTLTVDGNVTFITGNNNLTLPTGTTAARPSAASNGMIRYNTTLSTFEGYKAGTWGAIGGGATGGGSDDVFYENSVNVTSSYTITTNKNAMTAGPVTMADGITITIPVGSTWTIV
mgnify:FL=1